MLNPFHFLPWFPLITNVISQNTHRYHMLHGNQMRLNHVPRTNGLDVRK